MEVRKVFGLLLVIAITTKAFEISEEQYKNVIHKLQELKVTHTKEITEIKNDLLLEREQNTRLSKEIEEMKIELKRYKSVDVKPKTFNATDLEERVLVLELEVSSLQAAMTEVLDEVDDLETSQNTQDERMNSMEDNINYIEVDVDSLESGYVDLLVRVDTNEEDIILHREQIQLLENDLDDVEELVTVLDGRITELESSDVEITDRLEGVEAFVNVTDGQDIDSRVELLEVTASNHEAELDVIIANTTALATDLSELCMDVAENVLHITEIRNEVDVVENIVGSHAIGFHANLNDMTPYPEQIIVYGNVRLNLGNYYDSSSGVFVTPRAGLYYFSMHMRQVRIDSAADRLQVQKNGVAQCTGSTDSESTTHVLRTSTCNVILHLETGDEVSVYAPADADSEFLDETANSFNGFFIRGV